MSNGGVCEEMKRGKSISEKKKSSEVENFLCRWKKKVVLLRKDEQLQINYLLSEM